MKDSLKKSSPMSKELQTLLTDVNKKFGEGSVILFSDGAKKVPTITTGLPSLDAILGGGIPEGRVVEIFGPEGAGKTTMALHCLAKCQEAGKKAMYVDVENALDPQYAERLGVNMEELLFSQPDSAEQALDLIEKFADSGEVSVIVLDSVAALVPMANLAKEIDGTMNIATTARLMSQHLFRLANAARRKNCVLIFVNQVRMNIGGYGNPEVTPGGMALKFAASVRMSVRKRKPEERNGKKGQPCIISIKKNKIAPPFRETECFLEFGKGFDYTLDLLNACGSAKIITQSGAMFYLAGSEEKWRGLDSLMKAVDDDPKLKEKLEKALKTGEL